jgi:RHS repeat-associated protein
LGRPLTEKDQNNNTTTYAYDVFGRIVKVITPNDMGSTYGTVSYYYLNFGTVGSQKVVVYATEQSGTGNYIWNETYFDGLGRTIKTRSEGPDNKVIVTQAQYNNRGSISSESYPYFEGLGSVWKTYQYDPIGRVTRTNNPDGTYATSSYLKGTLTYINPNGHKKFEMKDIYGRVVKVEEYTGVSPSFSLYATTRYEYDVLGNVKKVTDAQNNQTVMNYDTLSRKISMTDPDMGYWTYQYDANGNLVSQTDAKNQTILITYDSLNRVTKKDYPTGTDVLYTYDEIFSTYPKGRLTTVTDASGTAKFYYDKLGRTIKTIKTVDSVNYTTEASFDALGRADTLTYPDNTILKYEYDSGGSLLRVKNNSTGLVYASYTGYNASGQIGRTDFGNGVNTIYQYLSQNNRLYSITTSKQSTGFINLSYAYDNVGNITGITDYLDSTKTRTYGYDDLNRLTSATSASFGGTLTWQYNQIGNMTHNNRYGNYAYGDPLHKHAVTQAGADTYTYDSNGNMTGGAGRTITHDYDNRATSIVKAGAATISVYDAGGQRVKKVIPGATTIYIGKYYECTSGVCTKYIFGGSDRIVSIVGTNTRYYHTDHLRSSSVITDQNGISVQALYYYPYGEIHSNIGSDLTKYKFTGQEWDAETGLYYYGARYYDPKLGKFITPDTIVPDFSAPQTLNRYSYCANNPILYTDPSGNIFIIDDIIIAVVTYVIANAAVIAEGAAIGAALGAISAGVQSGWDGSAMLQGAALGAVTGAVFAGVGGFIGDYISQMGVPGGVGPPTAGWAAAGNMGGAMAGGAASGAAGAAMSGGDVGKAAWQGAAISGVMAGLSEAASYMRTKMIEQSKINPTQNASGKSVGFKGDELKLGGGRWVEGVIAKLQKPSWLGGTQGGPGMFFGRYYEPGSWQDYLVEAYSGPHDYFNSGYWYNASGNAKQLFGVAKFFGEALNFTNVILVTPIVAASVVPASAYPMIINYSVEN